MRPTVPAIALLAVLTALAGCAAKDSGSGAGGAAADQLRGREFRSTSITEHGGQRPLAAGTTVSLRFTDDGRLLASAGCNSIAGPVRLSGGTLGVSELSTTELGCDPARHAQDEWLAGVLQAAPSWKLDGAVLTLTTGTTVLALTDREVLQPDLALRGPTWTVDTLVGGEAASSVPAGVTASLVFDQDLVTVAAGCNSGSAPYTVAGSTITFDGLVLTRKLCPPDVMQVENAVVAALQGGVEFDIAADRLVLKHPSGAGLQLVGGTG